MRNRASPRGFGVVGPKRARSPTEARVNRLEPDATWRENGRRNRRVFNYESHMLGLVGQGDSRGGLWPAPDSVAQSCPRLCPVL